MTPDTGPGLIEIANDGPDIVSTNYWDSPHAQRGLLYVSANAGVLRVLVPEATENLLPEMATGKRVTIEASMQDPRCWDLVFEDGSDAPFFLAVDKRQFDRALTHGSCRLTVWTRGGRQLDLDCTIEID